MLIPRVLILPRGAPTTVITPEPTPPPPPELPPVHEVIRSAAVLYGVDPILMERIAFCESSLHPSAVNPSGDASGLFQHIRTTWLSNVKAMGAQYTLDDRLSAGPSSIVAAFMLSKQGTRPWAASAACWSKW